MPTGNVQNTRNLDSYTLNEFRNLAENSRDNQELRIRKRNQELSNTALGFIARNFGSTHARSNTQVTQAFRHALQSDPKYREISAQLANVLSTQMPDNQPLTAAKVKSAIGMADRMLEAQDKSINLTEMAEDFGLVGKEQLPAFKSFVRDYLFNHPEVKLDLGNSGEQLTAEQRRMDEKDLQPVLRQQEGPKLQALAQVLKAFFAQGGSVAIEKGGYGISAAQTGGDAQNAAALNKLLMLNFNLKSTPEEILNEAFDLQNVQVPKSGCIARTFKNALHNLLDKKLEEAHMSKDMSGILHMKAEHINQISNAINTTPGLSPWEKARSVLCSITIAGTFYEQHPTLAAQPEKMQEALGKLAGKFVSLISSEKTTFDEFRLAGDELCVEMLLNEQDLSENGQSLFAKAGIDPKIGLAALSVPSVFSQIQNKVHALGEEHTEAQVLEAVRTEVGRFLEQNSAVLQKVQSANLPDNLIAAGVKTALAMDSVMTDLGAVQARNEEQLLEKMQLVSQALRDKSLSDADRGVILKSIVGEFTKTLPTGTEDLCRQNLPTFARLVGQLQTLSGDPNISKATRDACTEVAEIAQAIYNNLLALAPEERQAELRLVPDSSGPVNQNLAAGANPLKPFPRNASPARMFAGLQELEASDESEENKVNYRRAMESIGCPDYKLIALVNAQSTTWVSTSTKALTGGTQGYKVVSHLHNQISFLGTTIGHALEDLGSYDPEQLDEFIADIYLSGLSNEEKKNLLDSLKNPAVQDYLQVVNTYAQKNAELPDNAYDPHLLKLGNKGALLVRATKMLQIAANKSAEQLGQPAPGPIFNPNGTKTLEDLKQSFDFDENFGSGFTVEFRKYCNAFDGYSYQVGNNLSHEQHDAVKNLFGNLKVPRPKNAITTINGLSPDEDFSFSFTDAQGTKQQTSWSPKMLGILFAFKATEISQLLESTGGHPSAAQLWGVLHGGNPPAGLTMDNFADKLMRSVCQQIHNAGLLIGQNLNPSFFFTTCPLKIGMDPLALINKILQTNHGDVTFTVADQTGHSGMFPPPSMMGAQYQNGKEHYGFGIDFIRAIMPPGAQPGPSGETGCKITVQPEQGEPIVFNQSDYKKVPEDGKDAYLAQIPNEVRKLCQSDAQLAGVGICTTQAIQGALRSVPFFYWNVTGEGLEHTALDHHISKLENGNVLVKVSEKPGSLFKFNMQFEVAPDGMVSIRPESSLTLPSLEKVRAFQQGHPA